jgi:threonine synthase
VTIGVLAKLARAGKLDPDEVIVAYVTGNGLKTQEAVADRVREPILIRPSLRAFEESSALGRHLAHSVA